MEVLYSTGIRRSELCSLDRFDLDLGRGVLVIRHGKGNENRRVPVGERALDRVNRYLVEVCPEWVVDRHEEALFINQYVARPSADALSARVTRYVDAANLGKRGSCHLFRQTMATLMLEGGADVRCVQQMLREPQDHERVHPRLYRPAQKGA